MYNHLFTRALLPLGRLLPFSSSSPARDEGHFSCERMEAVLPVCSTCSGCTLCLGPCFWFEILLEASAHSQVLALSHPRPQALPRPAGRLGLSLLSPCSASAWDPLRGPVLNHGLKSLDSVPPRATVIFSSAMFPSSSDRLLIVLQL